MKSQKNKEHRTTKKKQRIMMRRIDAYDGFCLKPGRCGLEALKSFWRWFRILRSFPAKQRRRNCYVHQHFLEPVSGKTQVLLTNGFKKSEFLERNFYFQTNAPSAMHSAEHRQNQKAVQLHAHGHIHQLCRSFLKTLLKGHILGWKSSYLKGSKMFCYSLLAQKILSLKLG